MYEMATNHKDKNQPFRITVTGGDKLECVKRVIELEGRGYECIRPIFEVANSGKIYSFKEDGLKPTRLKMKSGEGAMFNQKWIAVMQKVEEVSEAS